MKISAAIAFAAMAATTVAADAVKLEKKQAATTPFNTQSAYLVLATAIPPTLLSEAITNPNAVSSEVASEFAAGSTPTWFSALPTDIKSYLLAQGSANPASSVASNAASVTSQFGQPPVPSYVGSAGTGMMPYGTNGTGPYATGSGASNGLGTVTSTVVGNSSASGTSSGGGSSSPASSTSGSGSNSGAGGSGSQGGSSGNTAGGASGSSAGAAMPTAAVGVGLGAVVGAFAMLAL